MLIADEVGDVLVAQLGVDPSLISETARLDGDLGLDSLSLTEALLILEDELVISIPDLVQVELRTFGDLVAAVASEVGGRWAPFRDMTAPAAYARQLNAT